MSTKRRIVVASLDTPVRSIVNECLPSDHFDIAEFDENASSVSTTRVDLVIFCAPKDLEQTQALCATLRSHVGHRVPRCFAAPVGTSRPTGIIDSWIQFPRARWRLPTSQIITARLRLSPFRSFTMFLSTTAFGTSSL